MRLELERRAERSAAVAIASPLIAIASFQTERPAMNPIHTVDALVERCAALWRGGARGFILYFMAPFDHETIGRVATEVRPKLEQAIA